MIIINCAKQSHFQFNHCNKLGMYVNMCGSKETICNTKKHHSKKKSYTSIIACRKTFGKGLHKNSIYLPTNKPLLPI